MHNTEEARLQADASVLVFECSFLPVWWGGGQEPEERENDKSSGANFLGKRFSFNSK